MDETRLVTCSCHAIATATIFEAVRSSAGIQWWYCGGITPTRIGTATRAIGLSSSVAIETPSVIVLANCSRSVPCTASHDVYSPPHAARSLSGSLTATAVTCTLRLSSSAGTSWCTSGTPSLSSSFLSSAFHAAMIGLASVYTSRSARRVVSQPVIRKASTAAIEAQYAPPQKHMLRPISASISSMGSVS